MTPFGLLPSRFDCLCEVIACARRFCFSESPTGEDARRSITHLPYGKDFTNIVSAQKEFNGGKVTEEIFDVPVVEYTL